MGQITDFGQTASGQQVHKIALAAHGLSVGILTLGAVLQSVRLVGVPHDLTLGSDDVADYQGPLRFHGSIIAPVANRIGGAQAVIADRLRQFEANDKGGSCLHSGSAGTHLQVWRLTDTTADSATLRIDLADGAGGFPGNRSLTARFSLCAPATLRLELGAQTDAPTIFNATSHSYWNLDGTTRWAGHTLQVLADHWLPTDAHARPTGEVALCDGSPLDFRQPIRITPENPALDHCFCLSAQRRALQKALVLTGASGVSMTVATTEPGVQIYDNRGPYAGLAIETQGWPDAPSHPHFPAITLQPGVSLHQITEWRFEHE